MAGAVTEDVACTCTGATDLAVADWAGLAQEAQVHGMEPLLHSALRALGGRLEPPAGLAEEWRRSYRRALLTNARNYRELGRLLDLFGRAQIPIVLLKGCVVARTLYADIAHRRMADLDFLIHKADLPQATEVLTAAGYAFCGDLADGFQEEMRCEAVFLREGEQCFTLEPHWHVFNPAQYLDRVPIEWFWDRTAGFDLDGRHATMLAPAAQLLHLSTHFALRHRGRGLRWSYDLALLLARHGDEIPWPALLEDARRFDLALCLQMVLESVHEAWGVEVPAEARPWVRGYRPSWSERIAVGIETGPVPAALGIWSALCTHGLGRRVRYLRTIVFPDAAYMRQRYGMAGGLPAPAYYAWRVLRGIGLLLRLARSMAVMAVRAFVRRVAPAARSGRG
jgi:hypothetical protein